MKTLKTITTIILSAALIMPVTVFATTNEAQTDSNRNLTDNCQHNTGNINSTQNRSVNTNDGLITEVTEHSSVTTNNGSIKTNDGFIQNNTPVKEQTVRNYVTSGPSPSSPVVQEQGTRRTTERGGYIKTNNGNIANNGAKVEVNNGRILTNEAGDSNPQLGPRIDLVGRGNNRYYWQQTTTTALSEGTVTTNNGTIDENKGIVNINSDTGYIEWNNGSEDGGNGSVMKNNGNIRMNTGNIQNNNGNGAIGLDENGIESGSGGNFGTLTNNYGTVTANGSGGVITNNSGTVKINDGGVIHENHGTIDKSYAGVVEKNYGTITENCDNSFHSVNVEENDGEITKNSGKIGLNTANAVVKTNNGEIQKNHGTVETNSGTVVNSDDGVVEVNFGGSVTAGTVKINLGDDGDTSNTNVLQQMWGVLAGAWDNLGFTANAGDTYDGHTDNDVKIWLWDEGTMVLQSKTSDILTNVSIKAGSAGTATITRLDGNKWQITGITGNIELDTEFTDPSTIPDPDPVIPDPDPVIPDPDPITPPAPGPVNPDPDPVEPDPVKPVKPVKPEHKDIEDKEEVNPAPVQPIVPEPVIETPVAAPVQFVSAIQVAIGVDDTTTIPANAVTVSSEQIAQLEAMAQAAVGPAYVVLSAFTINNTTIDPANADNTTLIASLSGLTAGSRIYLMFTDATGKTRYLPYTVTNDNQIVKKIKGISDGAMVTVLVKNN